MYDYLHLWFDRVRAVRRPIRIMSTKMDTAIQIATQYVIPSLENFLKTKPH